MCVLIFINSWFLCVLLAEQIRRRRFIVAVKSHKRMLPSRLASGCIATMLRQIICVLLGLGTVAMVAGSSDIMMRVLDNNAQAYNWKGLVPQSCQCMQTGVVASSCSLFRCTCTCDLNAGRCDYGCCCDPDCSGDQVSRFNTIDACRYEGYQGNFTSMCYSNVELAAINPRLPLQGVSSVAQSAVDQALCIQVTNFAFPGEYFTDIAVQSSTVFGTPRGKKNPSYVDSNTYNLLSDKYFDQNDTIAGLHRNLIGGTATEGPLGWRLPRTDFSGDCNDNNFVRFEDDWQGASCRRPVPPSSAVTDFTQQCQQSWSLNHYVNLLMLGSNADSALYSGTQVPITVTSFAFQDFYTGAVTALPVTAANPSNCATQVFTLDGTTTTLGSGGCVNPSSQALLDLASLSANTLICQSAVKSISYTIYHDTSKFGVIQSVTAAVVITNVPSYLGSFPVSYMQSFAVSFSSSNAAGVSQANGNQDARPRSGNPGYLLGTPVLFGTSSGQSTIVESPAGLKVPSSGGLPACPNLSNLAQLAMDPIAFGYDSVSGCTLSLSRPEFLGLCCQALGSCYGVGSSPYTNPGTGVPYFFPTSGGYVGVYGSSDPLDTTQWYQYSVNVPSISTRNWDELTGTCSNMYTSLNYKFLVAKSGEVANPQNKIVAVAVDVATGNMVMRVPRDDQITRQNFQLSITVSFIYKNKDELQGYVAPPPPVLFKVPYDAFYPFQIGAAAPLYSKFSALCTFSVVVFISTIVMYL